MSTTLPRAAAEEAAALRRATCVSSWDSVPAPGNHDCSHWRDRIRQSAAPRLPGCHPRPAAAGLAGLHSRARSPGGARAMGAFRRKRASVRGGRPAPPFGRRDRWFHSRAVPAYLPDGSIARWQKPGRRHRGPGGARRDPRGSSERQLRAIVDNIPAQIVTHNASGEVELENRAARGSTTAAALPTSSSGRPAM